MRRTKKLTATAGIAMASMLFVAGCSQADPSQEVAAAFANQEKATSQSVKISLDVEPAEFAEMFESNDDAADSLGVDGDTQRAALERFAQASMTIESRSTNDKPLSENMNLADLEWGAFFGLEDTRMISLVNVDDNYFIKADVKSIIEAVDMEPAEYDQLHQMVEQMPVENNWALKLITNEWITPDEALTQRLNTAINDSKQIKELTEEQEAKKTAMDNLKKSAFTKSDFTKNGDVITMDIPLKEVMSENKADVQTLFADDDDSNNDDVQETIDQMNDNKFPVQFTIKDENLTQVRLDPLDLTNIIEPDEDMSEEDRAEFEEMKGKDIPVVIDFSENTDNLVAPEGATVVTEDSINQLMGTFMGANEMPPTDDTLED